MLKGRKTFITEKLYFFYRRYSTSDGTAREETGVPNPQYPPPGGAGEPEGGGHSAAGSFSYVGPDGRAYSVRYSAGADGFVAEGDHLPRLPPLPPALQRWADAAAGRGRTDAAAAGAAAATRNSARAKVRLTYFRGFPKKPKKESVDS